jgi:hypothetical protein
VETEEDINKPKVHENVTLGVSIQVQIKTSTNW